MPTSDPSPPDGGRQRRLDDLFGDEPFLSPTMKARQLLDRTPGHLFGQDDASAGAAPRSPLLEMAPDVSEEDAASFWRQRTGSPRVTQWAEPDTMTSASDPELLPTPRMLKMVATLASSGALFTGTDPPNRHSEPIADPTPALPAHTDPYRTSREGVAFPPLPGGSRGAPQVTIPLAKAAAFLRSECPTNAAPPGLEALERLRTNVLSRWLKQVPARDYDRSTEE